MKKLRIVFFILCLIFNSQYLLAINASDVAIIDLSVALCLHPKMSLFDFNRIGFYKVEFGLSNEEFDAKVASIRASAPDRSDELRKIEKELDELYKERNKLSYFYINTNEEKMKKANELMEISLAKEEELERKKLELNFLIGNYDLTTPKETLVIIEEIEKDIFDAINEVVKENNYSIVLNSTVPLPYTFNKNYENSAIYGQGIPGINFMLFYSFLADKNFDNPLEEKIPSSRDLINWIELTRYPKAVNLLPMKPYPLVLSGGKSILSSVIKKIYNKYGINSSIYNVVDSVITKMEQLQYGKKVEQKTVKDNF